MFRVIAAIMIGYFAITGQVTTVEQTNWLLNSDVVASLLIALLLAPAIRHLLE